MASEGSSRNEQEPATCLYSEPMNPVLALPEKYATHILVPVYPFLKFYYMFSR